jgi:hypothetical protein
MTEQQLEKLKLKVGKDAIDYAVSMFLENLPIDITASLFNKTVNKIYHDWQRDSLYVRGIK